jgi:rRNA-processing protein FCF1
MSRILIDTNIIIYREDIGIVPDKVQELLQILNDADHKIVIHPLSLKEINKDRDSRRRDIVISKIGTYTSVDNPPYPESDSKFISCVGQSYNINDKVDDYILYCVYKDVVDFLITEDVMIRKKAEKLGISDRVFSVDDAIEHFKVGSISYPHPLEYIPVYNVDFNDSIFDSLKKDYNEFENWWKKISREGRKGWVHYVNGKIGAILILKDENEPVDSIPPLPKNKRLKICTLIVDSIDQGSKIGELFIKISVQTAFHKDIDEIYLTHFIKPDDFLIPLIKEFGFSQVAKKINGEIVIVKRLIPDEEKKYLPTEVYKMFYPSFSDEEDVVNKFIIPIRPEWHNRLFTDYKIRQLTLDEVTGKFIVEGNTIKKAYLSHSKINEMKEGDILLFYRSKDVRGITSLGIVEKIKIGVTDPNEIISYVEKRAVYQKSEIEEISKKPTMIIIFWWILYLKEPLKYKDLLDHRILNGIPQTILKVSHSNYLKIKEMAKINDRYTFN